MILTIIEIVVLVLVVTRLGAIAKATRKTQKATEAMYEQLDMMIEQLQKIRYKITGDTPEPEDDMPTPPPSNTFMDRVREVLSGEDD